MERIVKYAYRFLFASAVWWACACGADNPKDNGGTNNQMSEEDPDREERNDGGERYKTGTNPGEVNHEDPTGEKEDETGDRPTREENDGAHNAERERTGNDTIMTDSTHVTPRMQRKQ
jgi:hypothetical protein